MAQKFLLALLVSSGVMLAGCGGGSSSNSSPTDPGGGGGTSDPVPRNDVAGPLDAVQDPVSSQILAPLAAATATTGLGGVIECVDQIVVHDTLDVVDAIALAADTSTSFTPSADAVQAEVSDLVADLQTLLGTLAGASGCATLTVPGGDGLPGNPLDGGPLSDFGDTLLTALTDAQGQLDLLGTSPDLSALSAIVGTLASGYADAIALLPAEAQSAPVVGPSLLLIGQALNDLQTTVDAASSGDQTATANALTATVDNLVQGLLTEVVPIADLESGTGTTGAITDPIEAALAQLSGALAGGFTTPDADLVGALTTPITDALAPLLAPLSGGDPTTIIESLSDQFGTAILEGLLGGGGGAEITGNLQIDSALASLTALLEGAGGAQSPLQPLVDALTGLFDLLML